MHHLTRRKFHTNETFDSTDQSSEEVFNVIQGSGLEELAEEQFLANPQPMYVYDIETFEILAVNKAAIKKYRYEKEEFLALKLEDLRPPEEIPEFLKAAAHLTSYVGDAGVWEHVSKNGHRFMVEVKVYPMKYKGRSVNLTKVKEVFEVTEREEMRQMALNEMRFHLGNTPLGFIEWNRIFRLKFTTRKTIDIIGCEPQELIGMSGFELINNYVCSSDLLRAHRKTLELNDGTVTNNKIELKINSGDSKIRYTRWYNSVLKDRRNQMISVLSIIEDLTEQRELEQSRNRLIEIIESTPDLIGMATPDGRVMDMNAAGKKLLSIRPDVDISKKHVSDFHSKEESKRLFNNIFPEVEKKGIWQGEFKFRDRNGNDIPVSSVFLAHHNDEGKIDFYSTISRDITEYYKAERELQLHKNLLAKLFRYAPIGIVELDGEDRVVSVNKSFEEMFQYRAEEIRNKKLSQLITPENLQTNFGKLLKKQKASKGTLHYESVRIRKDGTEIPVLIGLVPVFLNAEHIRTYVLYMDFSKQKSYEMELKSAMQEKEILLQEIHHRVKNNLAIVSGLLELKRMNTVDDVLSQALSESQMRIKSMALIHEMLYQSESLSKIELAAYVDDLVKMIDEAMNRSDKIEIEVECDSFDLNVNQAITCALILNELITNSIEHAFVGQESGRIDIQIGIDDSNVSVRFKDNGKGYPEKFDEISGDSLGFLLIKTFMNQLKADYSIRNENGAYFSFSFVKNNATGSSNAFLNS